MVLVYDDIFGIKGACLRITNTYGPRHQMAHDEYGVFNWFIRKAIDNEAIPVFGDGRILRDFIYVDDIVDCMLMTAASDIVVDCMLMTAASDNAYGEVFNVGTGIPVSFVELAKKIVEIAGSGHAQFTEFTQERKEVEPGDYYTNITKIKQTTGWKPLVSLDEGIKKTIEYYRKYKKEYW